MLGEMDLCIWGGGNVRSPNMPVVVVWHGKESMWQTISIPLRAMGVNVEIETA